MADNLCGASTPAKGLVNHLNGDRTMQQDRIVNSSPAASGSVSLAEVHEFSLSHLPATIRLN